MIEAFVALVLIPTAVIWTWTRMVAGMSVLAWDAYRYTGLIGTPVHELAHAVSGLLFGLRIQRMSLYAPNAITGELGYVQFRYRIGSLLHALGLAVQGFAPLLAGAVIVTLVLGHQQALELPNRGVGALLVWIGSSVQATVGALLDLLGEGIFRLLSGFVLLMIAMHAIPSTADIRTGIKGALLLGIFLGALSFAGEGLVTLLPYVSDVDLPVLVQRGLIWLEIGMLWSLFGAVSVVTLAVAGSILFILMPATVWYCYDFIRGARGQFD